MQGFHLFGFALLLVFFFMSVNYVYATSDSNEELVLLPSTDKDFPKGDIENIDVLFTNSYQSSGSYRVNDAFENAGNTILENVKVVGYFYDENKQMVGVTDCCYTDPDNLEPGQTARFDSFVEEKAMTGIPKYYKLAFEWNKIDDNQGSENIQCGMVVKKILNYRLILTVLIQMA